MRNSEDEALEIAYVYVARHFSAQNIAGAKTAVRKLVELFGSDLHFVQGDIGFESIHFRVSRLTIYMACQTIESENILRPGSPFAFAPIHGENKIALAYIGNAFSGVHFPDFSGL